MREMILEEDVSRRPLHVGLLDSFHRRRAAGAITVRGRVAWDPVIHPLPPRVHLLINGDNRAVQQTIEPEFRVEPNQMKSGTNVIQLVAELDGGETASTKSPLTVKSTGMPSSLRPRCAVVRRPPLCRACPGNRMQTPSWWVLRVLHRARIACDLTCSRPRKRGRNPIRERGHPCGSGRSFFVR
jgi:hypothetical protein